MVLHGIKGLIIFPAVPNLDCQTLDYPSVDQMLANNLFYITLIYIGIPDRIRVYDQHRPLRTTVETPGCIDTDTPLTGDTQFLAASFREIPHAPGIKTLAAVTAIRTQIGTEEHMVAIVRHAYTIQERER